MKTIVSLLLSLIMVLMLIPFGMFSVNAATGGVQQALNKIKAVYPDQYTYFTGSGKACYDAGGDDCYIQNIPARGGLPSGKEVYNMGAGGGWSCNGFARYVFGYIFGKNFKSSPTVSTPSIGDVLWTTSSYGDHYSIYLGQDSTNWYVFDSNWGLDCSVRYYGAINKSKHTLKYIYHASNYNEINGSTPDPEPSITYADIAEGTYFLKNNSNQMYLHVPSANDAQEQNILTYDFCNSNADKIKITKDGSAYKLQPACSSTRVVNAYAWTVSSGNNVNLYDDTGDSSQRWYFEKVSGGYIIRNGQTSSCVLAVDSSDNAYVTTYTGASSQIWSIQNVIDYDENGGTGAPSGLQFKNYGESITLSSTKPTRSGYTFLGWSTSSSATSATYSAGGSFTSNKNTTLYAVWGKNTYTVSYNANGGSGAPSSQTKTHGVSLTLSSTKPTRSGYTFLGWSTSSTATSATYSAGSSYTNNASVTLYAVWKKNLYTNTITHWKYVGTGGDNDAGNYKKMEVTKFSGESGKSVTIPQNSVQYHTGYYNTGEAASDWGTGSWSLKYIGSTFVQPDTDMYIEYYYMPKTVTVEFNINDGSGETSKQTFVYAEQGKRFGFNSDGTPKWYNNSGQFGSWDRTGYTLLGWSTSASATSPEYSVYQTVSDEWVNSKAPDTNPTSTIRLYAVWKANTYTVSYNANGGSGAPSSQTKTHGVSLTLSSTKPTRSGYTFLGWSTSSSATSATYSAGATFTANADTTLYAVWKKNSTTFTVEYRANGGTGSMANTTVTYGVNTALRANTFTKTGYTFAGWKAYRISDGKWYYTNAAGKTGWYKEGSQPAGYTKYVYKDKQCVSKTTSVNGDSIRMFPTWKVNTFKINYRANGGTGTMSDTTVTYGKNTALKANTFTKTGYTFAGWKAYRISDGKWYYTNAAGKTGWYKEGSQPSGYTKYVYKDKQGVSKTTSVNGDTIRMFATWKVNTFKINYRANGGTGTMSDTTVTYGKNTALKANTFTKTGYTFAGWKAYRISDGKWYYVNSAGQTGWYKEGSQPAGYTKYVYKDKQGVSKTTSVNGDTIRMFATWKKK